MHLFYLKEADMKMKGSELLRKNIKNTVYNYCYNYCNYGVLHSNMFTLKHLSQPHTIQRSNIVLGEEFGCGAYGMVYACDYFETTATLKFGSCDLENDYEREDFEEKRDLVESLNHPKIVQYFDSWAENDRG